MALPQSSAFPLSPTCHPPGWLPRSCTQADLAISRSELQKATRPHGAGSCSVVEEALPRGASRERLERCAQRLKGVSVGLTPKLKTHVARAQAKAWAGRAPEVHPPRPPHPPSSSLHLFISRHWTPCGLCQARASLVAARRLKGPDPPPRAPGSSNDNG